MNRWEVKKIKDIALVTAGQSPEGKYYNENSVGLPFYQGKKEFTEKYIGEPKVWTTFITKEAIEGDVLMSVRAPVGPVNFATQKCCIGRGLASIRVKEKFDKDFLFLFFKNIENQLTGNAGAVFNSINKSQIENIEIPIPPLEEQRTIVAKLDQAFAAIDQAKANIEKNIANAKELFQSKLNQIFSQKGEGWEEKKLNQLGKIVSGATPKSNISEYWSGNIHWITPKDLGQLGESKFINDTSRKISEKGLKSCSAILMPAGSIIMSSRAPIGYLAISNVEICTNQGCKSIVPNEDISNIYLYYYLLKSKDELNKLGKGAVFPEISGKVFGEFIINIPKSLETQQKIVTQLDQLQEQTNLLVTKYQQKLANLEELKKSILEKAFKGELS